ncbi:hypothetical protein Val02_60250 [Virgisporangium aliadipatigenens]|uniref:Uncharacterized protein n=1 Tax=Virgisporangium aliadipatigenens TaxID=741659 RepID=A0A8J3YP56_9ACTN|nr:hypothetical protein [Virgisporangium aliadipatigenens]GIJ49139.1 hypothetical protein Val02_60250 [Virgisporangium aliadipatigenens]
MADSRPSGEIGSWDSAPKEYSSDPGHWEVDIDSTALWSDGVKCMEWAEAIIQHFSDLMTKYWIPLHIGWAGQSEEEATRFFNTFTDARVIFYGLAKDEKRPESVPADSVGMLTQLCGIVKSAAALYGQAEETGYQTFKQLANSVGYSLYDNKYPDEYPKPSPADYPEYKDFDQEDRWWIDALYEKKASAEDPVKIKRDETNSWDQPGVPDNFTVGD